MKNYNSSPYFVIIIVFIIIIILLIFITLLNVNEHYRTYLDYPSKCFSCERDFIDRYGEDYAWMGNQTKLFSAEYNGVLQANGDPSGGFMGKTIKYY